MHTSSETSDLNLGPGNILMQKEKKKKGPSQVHYIRSLPASPMSPDCVPKLIIKTCSWPKSFIHVSDFDNAVLCIILPSNYTTSLALV